MTLSRDEKQAKCFEVHVLLFSTWNFLFVQSITDTIFWVDDLQDKFWGDPVVC